METFKKVKKVVFNIYYGIGAASLGLLACLVMFAVVMRYIWGKSWGGLSEFNVVLFAFSTLWGMGLCILKEEHVIIDIFYDKLNPKIKRIFALVNYTIVLAVVGAFIYLSYSYTALVGKQISLGMRIPMYYMYGLMPICGIIAFACCIIKLIDFATCDESHFAAKNKVLTKDDVAAVAVNKESVEEVAAPCDNNIKGEEV
ncbi:MAG: TRAP transporter small permease [Bacillota bacterium]